MNPEYKSVPLRGSDITHIIWHDAGISVPFSARDLILYDLQSNHISSKGCPCPTMTYYVQADSRVFQLGQETWRTWHCGVPRRHLNKSPKWNEFALGIGFEFLGIGRVPMSIPMFDLGVLLTAEIAARRAIPVSNILGHRECAGTGYVPGFPDRIRKPCPGMAVDMRLVRSRVQALLTENKAGLLQIVRLDLSQAHSYI